jgi:hypothetical protein
LADFLNSSPLKSLGKSYHSFNRGEDFLKTNQSETRIACGPIGTKLAIFIEDLPYVKRKITLAIISLRN